MSRRTGLLAKIAIINIYLVILAGAVVRMTGSGMGCPDWPKCFGQWVPPTEASQLPADYKNTYAAKRLATNEDLARYLNSLGLTGIASNILNDPSIYVEEDFNAVKTYTEYINRLVGASSGLVVFLLLISSLIDWGRTRGPFFLSLGLFVLLGFQGWFGSIVVSTKLLPGTVSIHMLLAFGIIALLLVIIRYSKQYYIGEVDRSTRMVAMVALIVLLTQVVMGSQVRQDIDILVASGNLDRSTWIGLMGNMFYVHRSFSILLVLLVTVLAFRIYKYGISNPITLWLMVFGLGGAISGIIMAYFNVPAPMQSSHLVLSTLLFGLILHFILQTRRLSTQTTQ